MVVENYGDDAKRIAHEMSIHAVAKSQGWAVFSLSDGSSPDHFPYPRRTDAVKAMKWDRDNYLYLEIQPDGMHPKEAEAVLGYARFLHSKGWRLPDPDFDYDPTMPMHSWDQKKTAKHLISGGKQI